MSTSYNDTSTMDMQSEFKMTALAPIIGKPNLHSLLRLLRQVCRCSQTTKPNLGQHGYLFVALSPKHYVRFITFLLNLTGPTPPLPNLQGILDSGQSKQIKINWTDLKTMNKKNSNINEALTTHFF